MMAPETSRRLAWAIGLFSIAFMLARLGADVRGPEHRPRSRPPDLLRFCCLEVIQNVAKHADATRATVRVWTVEHEVGFSVADDGRGFDRAVTARGAGLQNMADRLAALGGSLDVRSEPGAGTTIEGRVPIG